MRFSRKEEFRRQLERPAFIAGNGDEWEGRTNEIGAEEGAKSPGHRQNHEDSGSQEQVGPISPEDHSGVISSVDALLDDYRAVALYSHRTTEGLYKHLRRKVMSGFSQLDDEGTTSQVPSIERSANEALGVVHNEPCNADGQQSPPDNTIGSSPNEVAHHPLKHPEVVSESDHMRVCDAGTRTADVISHLNTDIEPASDQSCAAAQENARVNADFWTTYVTQPFTLLLLGSFELLTRSNCKDAIE
ncbi:uncharacterized protein EI97DRAFT_157901 [Westerdykella ornata]|uniref:Uncharacterized protein n=1 Tax=Westerdykella ornata TaxID=318751 RepID=A0A6A6JAX7_WESOR|nr:uncharacterized protein EI97DRAFT_157901 [Westerdykella ornata]KAF2273435.1 hypothetical protein EI97DRAFT_157901 [Westerdykella ornata]